MFSKNVFENSLNPCNETPRHGVPLHHLDHATLDLGIAIELISLLIKIYKILNRNLKFILN